ncbi:MAG: RluA family pseudouridine synthase [Oscillospiraceae bacterium]|nr:RluA family pseudouridine synthase [Oscillospiraceae bacterium]
MAESLVARVKLRETGILLNGIRARTNTVVSAGDILTVEVGDEETAPKGSAPDGIVYEDEDIIVFNKPPNLASHGRREKGGDTVESLMRSYLGTAVHLVNRLDYGTAGLMVIAKSTYVTDLLRRALHTDDFFREYLAVTAGEPAWEEKVIDLPICREGEGHYRSVGDGGLAAETRCRVLARKNGRALVSARPVTGRTHQIRVHMAAVGYPLVGDWLYGRATEEIDRPALFSYRLSLRQPVTGERIELTAELPQDMAELMK